MNKYAQSSIERANTFECKEKIKKISCMFEEQNKLAENLNDLKDKNILYELYSESKCPKAFKNNRSADFFQGCIEKSYLETHLKALSIEDKNEIEKKFTIQKYRVHKNINSLETCVNLCLTINQYSYSAYDKNSLDCVCLKNLSSEIYGNFTSECSNIGKLFSIYHTGLLGNINLIK